MGNLKEGQLVTRTHGAGRKDLKENLTKTVQQQLGQRKGESLEGPDRAQQPVKKGLQV